jgi:non-haem Fe2+, alpha-ketoglutarate-dependent halogenase
MKALTEEQVASYRYDGFLFPIPALTPKEVAACFAGLERLERELGSPVAGHRKQLCGPFSFKGKRHVSC